MPTTGEKDEILIYPVVGTELDFVYSIQGVFTMLLRGWYKNEMEGVKVSTKPNGYTLPDNLRGKSIHAKVIPNSM